MAPKLVLTVFGATGNQGSSIVRLVHQTPSLNDKYQIRAITRDTSKPSAQELSKAGAEVVQADLNDPRSVHKAIAGSYAVFGVTDFWAHANPSTEEQQGRSIADASIAAGVRHLVWSSLPNGTNVSGGTLPGLVHFDSKANVERYIEEVKQGSETAASYFMPAPFMSNLPLGIRKGPDGKFGMAGPQDPGALGPWIDIHADAGKWVLGLLEAGPEKANGLKVQAVGEWATPHDLMTRLGKAVGVEYKFTQLPREVFKGFLPEKIAEIRTEALELCSTYQYYGPEAPKNQGESDKWLLDGTKKTTIEEYANSRSDWPQ